MAGTGPWSGCTPPSAARCAFSDPGRRLLDVHALHTLRQVQGILRLAERFDVTKLEQACARALAAGDARYQTVRGILERGLEAEPLDEPTTPVTSGAYLRGADAFAGTVR